MSKVFVIIFFATVLFIILTLLYDWYEKKREKDRAAAVSRLTGARRYPPIDTRVPVMERPSASRSVSNRIGQIRSPDVIDEEKIYPQGCDSKLPCAELVREGTGEDLVMWWRHPLIRGYKFNCTYKDLNFKLIENGSSWYIFADLGEVDSWYAIDVEKAHEAKNCSNAGYKKTDTHFYHPICKGLTPIFKFMGKYGTSDGDPDIIKLVDEYVNTINR